MYQDQQNAIIEKSTIGDLIPGSGGIRKIRWAGSGRGRRGDIRVIYYWATAKRQVYMLTVYGKAERSDLTKKQLAALRKAIEEEFGDG
jgi:mRNA-degrading endonuclease RelE of RelBE toxin-antitoxin system